MQCYPIILYQVVNDIVIVAAVVIIVGSLGQISLSGEEMVTVKQEMLIFLFLVCLCSFVY